MQHTTLEMFREELLATGAYKSVPERMAAKVRKPGIGTTIGFSASVFSVFPSCGWAESWGYLTTDVWAHYCFKSIRKAESYGTPFICEGWDTRKNYQGPVVYVANHMSTLETILLPFILLTYGPFNVVVKQSLSRLPFLEKAAAHMGLIPIGRKSPKEDLMTMLSVGRERISQGNSILIFAQGSRYPVFSARKFSSIGAKLAEKSQVPVIPIALKTDILPTRPKGKGWFKDFGTVDTTKEIRVACGPVLNGSAKEMHSASFDWIASKLESWQMPVER